ncbi:bifunctional 2',3'-cyclic-nucleotide 2'-phosphodiesterase/3'-nucleotidase [uncultured Shimia sp.]|uniref:bifunctional 2',3'-cyclic-nucleotide 2'-phosphodiesterase/3'-nucleotidase n=1 Tax=uncultured Shimia sp. TaxID=573152 RepID=UPI002607B334|nr:bifunctional 2',3'-cyclic-nucleotide 2'-phosphodiesterase/3'-nucleotidase [uncultured Shimia sp.]
MPTRRASDPDAAQICLTVLATTDLHGHLLSYDYYSDRVADVPALGRVATLVKGFRAASANTVLVDNGDFLQGTPLCDLASDDQTLEMRHPITTAMSELKYDAVALGNHEFNVSLSRLTDLLSEIEAPILCANLAPTVHAPLGLDACWSPQIILDKQLTDSKGHEHLVRIGLFSVCPPQVMNWDHSRVHGKLTAGDSLEAAEKAVQSLRESGADIVIGLCHMGLGDGPYEKGMENAGLPISAIEGLDTMVLGHTHLHFPGENQPQIATIDLDRATVNGTPTVQPGFGGDVLGKIDLTLEKSKGRWQVVDHHVDLLATKDVPEDSDFVEALQPAHNWALKKLREPVGEISQPIHSFLALLPGCPSVRIIAESLARFAQERLRQTEWSHLPVLAAAAPQKFGGRSGVNNFTRIQPGKVALNHISDLQYFPNDISALRLSGAEVADWLEMAASIYNQILPGQSAQPLHREDFPVYNSDTIYGLSYEIDLSQPPRFASDGTLQNPSARRIRNLSWQGAPVPPDQIFALAVNNYRAGGGGNFPLASQDRILFEDHTKIRDLLVEAFTLGDPSVSDGQVPWRFSRIPAATAVINTHPDMAEILEKQFQKGLRALELTLNGFLALELDLS